MTGDASRKRKLLEQPFQTAFVLRDVGIKLTVGSLQISVCHQTWSTVTWTSDIENIEVILLNDAVEMYIDEIQTWRSAQMAQQPWFHMFQLQGLFEQRIIVQINLADRQVVGGSPIG